MKKAAVLASALVGVTLFGAQNPSYLYSNPTYAQMDKLIKLVEAGGGGGGGVTPQALANATGELARVTRGKDDLTVYRKVKDIWVWTSSPTDDAPHEAPADFLAYANSLSSKPIYYKPASNAWLGVDQFWPDGKLKYGMSDLGPGGDDGTSTNIQFKITAYDRTGKNALFRFGAKAVRQSATDETLISWSDQPVNQFVRIATTDLVDSWLRGKADTNDFVSATNDLWNAADEAKAMISPSNSTFSAAVLAVSVDFDYDTVTNAVAAIADFRDEFKGIEPAHVIGGSAGLGALVLALLGAVTWLKKNAATKKSLQGMVFDANSDADMLRLLCEVGRQLGATIDHFHADTDTGADLVEKYGLDPQDDNTTFGQAVEAAGLSDSDTIDSL